jgi:hypothetical protein
MKANRFTWKILNIRKYVLSGICLALMLVMPGMASADTSNVEVTLKVPEVLTLVPCSIEALPGQTVEGDLHDCVTGGDGNPHFGPIGTYPTPGGGSVTIDPDGHYTYTAPDSPGTDTIPFTAIDSTVPEPLPGIVDVTIVEPLDANSFTFHIAPGGSLSGNLNDYVTGGIGERTFGPIGVAMPTPGGGTITIGPDGSFTYGAPLTGDEDSFPWNVNDESGNDPLESFASIVIDGTLPPETSTPDATRTPAPTATATVHEIPGNATKTPGAPGNGGSLPSTGSGHDSQTSTGWLLLLTLGLAAGLIAMGARGSMHKRRAG